MKQFLPKILLALLLGLVLPQLVFATDLFFEAKINEVRVGEQFEIKLFVNTSEESINAFEGQILFPNDLLELKEINNGGSIVNFWIEKPKVNIDEISFSGITPGGFKGENGEIFSMIFEAKKLNNGSIIIKDIKLLKNDGLGTSAKVAISNFNFFINEEKKPIIYEKENDYERPETFKPEIARDVSMFNNKWFLVFATQDKGSGVDFYEVKEFKYRFFSIFKNWELAESPYVLNDQKLESFIFVKVFDKSGNERIEKVLPQKPINWYENYENYIIIIMVLLIIYKVRKFLWKK